MPLVKLNLEKMTALLHKSITLEQLEERIPWIGVEIEERGEDWIKIEYNPNRPDLSSQEGIARAFKGLQEIETGLPKYVVTKGKILLVVDESVKRVRPFIVGAVCKNIKLSDSDIEGLMAAQEDIHWAVGRDRRKASIGLHNLDTVTPPFTYKAVGPKSIKFTPLGSNTELDMEEILTTHSKGIAYRHLVDGFPKYPIIVDKDGRVLSFPPIINGMRTQVNNNTSNLFIDVTGTSFISVNNALNLIVTQLAEMGGKIESITLVEGEKRTVTPVLKPTKLSLSTEYVNRILGLQLKTTEIAHCLRKERFDAEVIKEGRLSVLVPPYRVDILHEVDLVEEVAVGYGYYNIQPKIPSCLTMGKLHIIGKQESSARRLMIGMGYQEIVNFTLTNEVEQYDYMRVKGKPLAKLQNPVSSEYSILRESLLPGLMRTLKINKHEKLPQRLFEVGEVIHSKVESEAGVGQELHFAATTAHSAASFAEIKSVLTALVAGLVGDASRISFAGSELPSFLKGRTAKVLLAGNEIAVLGELHPEVITNFELEYPVAAFEVNAKKLFTQTET
jgi:phenylalanyl-tRNA synthetase beta chain